MKKWRNAEIPVIDLFAGPGGLGEGFASCRRNQRRFRIGLSVEMEPKAHETLTLRSFFRQFAVGDVPDDYYRHLRGELTRLELFGLHPKQAADAAFEACQATMGEPDGDREIARRLDELRKVADLSRGVVIGGPPCQAYSLVGRSRMAKARESGAYRESDDGRHVLYKQYLKIIRKCRPAAFVMENVRGILSAQYEGSRIFEQILRDLRRCGYDLVAFGGCGNQGLFEEAESHDYLLHAHEHGVPQQRARVFVVGFRSDLGVEIPPPLDIQQDAISVQHAIGDLPQLRSGLSRSIDSLDGWKEVVSREVSACLHHVRRVDASVADEMKDAIARIFKCRLHRGAEFVRKKKLKKPHPIASTFHDWVRDERLGGVINHSTRGHMDSDLARYLFLSAWTKVHGRSPVAHDFPKKLLPEHANIQAAKREKSLRSVAFADRFRVQAADRPATTVTSHIAKDGHYYIHPEPHQCRSLTVREAARLQSFPDNYKFCGGRTDQYRQVGNAVPPLLANQIANEVCRTLGMVL